MAGRGWDDRWQHYPASVPLAVEGGLVTSKQRGAMAATWWSQRFTEVLESFGLGGRMARGRRYARTGQVMSLEVRAGVIAAQVQGSRRTPYLVTISLSEPSDHQWHTIDDAIAAKVGFVAHLLSGEVPADLEDVFHAAGVALFPHSWSEIRSDCNCPDWENPCKHIAAVLYVFADQLDSDPWLALAWRGRTRDQILERFRARRDEPVIEEVAPWWPFAPGPLPPLAAEPQFHDRDSAGPDEADLVLDALEPLDVVIGTTPLVELLRPVYTHIVTPDPDPAL